MGVIEIIKGDFKHANWEFKKGELKTRNGLFHIDSIPISEIYHIEKIEVIRNKYYVNFEVGMSKKKFTATMTEDTYANIYDFFVKNEKKPSNVKLPIKKENMDFITNIFIIILVPTMFFFEFSSSSQESTPTPTTNKACDLLSDVGLQANNWHELEWDNTYTCTTPYVDIKPISSLSNNIAYYVTGTKDAINQYKLVTNFNNPKQSVYAINKTVESASLLIEKALHVVPPQEILKAIKDKKTASWYVNDHRIDIQTIPWGNKKGGFEIKILIDGNKRII